MIVNTFGVFGICPVIPSPCPKICLFYLILEGLSILEYLVMPKFFLIVGSHRILVSSLVVVESIAV